MVKTTQKIELCTPAGSFETLMAAIKAGADSVYFGVSKLNMRSRGAINFTIEDLPEIVKICKKNNVKTYLALNIVMYNSDLEDMKKICDAAKTAKIDALICTDFSAIEYANNIGIKVHLSTQCNISNIDAVRFYSKFADVIVLARELSLQQVTDISSAIKKENICGPSGKLIRIEIFVHGALCVSVAGKCYMSLATYNHSANRGDCLQNCRRAYKVTDLETGDELEIDNKYVMSPKDLCTIGIIDKLIGSGAQIFKIEGRARKADYVFAAVKAYKEAIQSVEAGTYSKKKSDLWTKELEKVYNRGFWQGGYYLGNKLGEWSGVYGSKATTEKEQIGKALNYYPNKKVALFSIECSELKVGDDIIITGPTTGLIIHKIDKMVVNDKQVKTARKGDEVSFILPEKVRRNDKLFVVRERKSLG